MSHNHVSMGNGDLLPHPAFPKVYWSAVGSAIGVATLVNVFNHVLYRQRMASAGAGLQRPAQPKSLFFIACATVFAMIREASNFSIRIPMSNHILRLPTVGRTTLITANMIVLVVLCFYGFDMSDRWSREEIGFRCGFMTIAQLPLIFLLAGKNNIVGYLTGVSHERLNWIHRWCARSMLFTATIHMGYFFSDWAPYDYIGVQLKENTIVWKGLVAWVMLVWIVFSSFAPIRGWCYEFFVLQHLVSFAVLIGFVYIHTPAEVHAYIWIPVGLFFFDRVIRALRMLYANLALFHPKQRKAGEMSGIWACRAEFTPLAHNTTRVVITNPPIRWNPGQHVFLSCHSIVPLQSHPFTIASIPADGKMEFLVKAETGGTKRFFRHAEKIQGLPQSSGTPSTRTVAIEGPYGCLRPLRQFDSVILLAGSSGATFTVPLLRDIVQGWAEKEASGRSTTSFFSSPTGAVTRHARFVWVVKSRGQLEWFSAQLSSVYSEFDTLQERIREIKLEMSIYVTCDDTFTEEHKSIISNITAQNPNAVKNQQGSALNFIEFRSRTPSFDEKDKKKLTEPQEVIRPLPSSASITSRDEALACGPEGECYCKTIVENEPDSPNAITPWCCRCAPPSQDAPNPSSPRPASQTSSNPSTTSRPELNPLIHPSISVFSGRPNPRNIIRKSLEQAWGESAVVVCGPQGLVSDVKRDVCALSDERAVHKGTGAQGIYLHTESFKY